MLDTEQLLELTERYLKDLVANTAASLSADFDAAAPFGELGIDSFRILKITKTLEADFGRLPKTLLFENFNIEALTRYFLDKHEQALRARFSAGAPASPPAAAVAAIAPVETPRVRVPSRNAAVRLLYKDLHKYPELQGLVQKLFDSYGNEGGVSRGTGNIAPNLFIGSERRGYFNYGRSNDIIGLCLHRTGGVLPRHRGADVRILRREEVSAQCLHRPDPRLDRWSAVLRDALWRPAADT
jgi:polyketide synthase PksN